MRKGDVKNLLNTVPLYLGFPFFLYFITFSYNSHFQILAILDHNSYVNTL